MAYPEKPLKDYERAFEMGRDIKPPEIPMPPNLRPTRIEGGAPKLSESELPDVPTPMVDPGYMTPQPEYPQKGEGPYWTRLSLPKAPTRHTIYAPAPWERKAVEETYGPAIKQLGDTLWDRYQNLPPEQQALPAWQQVAQNPQQAAYSIMSRALVNKARISSSLTQDAATRIRQAPIYRWLNAIGGE